MPFLRLGKHMRSVGQQLYQKTKFVEASTFVAPGQYRPHTEYPYTVHYIPRVLYVPGVPGVRAGGCGPAQLAAVWPA